MVWDCAQVCGVLHHAYESGVCGALHAGGQSPGPGPKEHWRVNLCAAHCIRVLQVSVRRGRGKHICDLLACWCAPEQPCQGSNLGENLSLHFFVVCFRGVGVARPKKSATFSLTGVPLRTVPTVQACRRVCQCVHARGICVCKPVSM